MNTPTEARRLRAAIYGDVSDASWAKLEVVWTDPDNFRWLLDNQPRHCAPCPKGMHWKTWNGHPDAPR